MDNTISQVSVKPAAAMPATPGEAPMSTYTKKKAIFRTYQIIWYILGFIETILVMRMIFKILGANSRSGFVDMIYSMTDPLVLPFRGIFPTPAVSNSVFEFTTIIAIIIYALIAWGLVNLFQLVKPTNPEEVEYNVNSV